MKILLHPTYFPPVSYFVAMLKGEVVWEIIDHYQKQTYRNRTYLFGAMGKQLLTVPVQHTGKDGHQTYCNVKIAYDFDWRKQHRKTLETNYRSSPFFEFYEDDIVPVFEKKHTFLIDLNLETIQLATRLLSINICFERADSYKETYENALDFRSFSNSKKEISFGFEAYPQVFQGKYGFIENLSVLDLIFNEGRHATSYLERQSLNSAITGK